MSEVRETSNTRSYEVFEDRIIMQYRKMYVKTEKQNDIREKPVHVVLLLVEKKAIFLNLAWAPRRNLVLLSSWTLLVV